MEEEEPEPKKTTGVYMRDIFNPVLQKIKMILSLTWNMMNTDWSDKILWSRSSIQHWPSNVTQYFYFLDVIPGFYWPFFCLNVFKVLLHWRPRAWKSQSRLPSMLTSPHGKMTMPMTSTRTLCKLLELGGIFFLHFHVNFNVLVTLIMSKVCLYSL